MKIELGSYGEGVARWIGWVAAGRWIAFLADDGSTLIFRRDETGAVKGEPLQA